MKKYIALNVGTHNLHTFPWHETFMCPAIQMFSEPCPQGFVKTLMSLAIGDQFHFQSEVWRKVGNPKCLAFVPLANNTMQKFSWSPPCY